MVDEIVTYFFYFPPCTVSVASRSFIGLRVDNKGHGDGKLIVVSLQNRKKVHKSFLMVLSKWLYPGVV